MEIQISNDQNKIKIASEEMIQKARIILNALDCEADELSILLVDDQKIRELNREYRNIDKPTNVLSFPMQEGMFHGITPTLLGDVAISLETAVREAESSGITLAERISQLLIHGILHLTGYDHEKGSQELREMELKSIEILRLIETNPELPFF